MEIREFTPEDYEIVTSLWRQGNIDLGLSDTKEEILKMHRMNPDLFLVGEIDRRVAAVVMGGYDGRRGIVHHLAVDKALRHRRLARMMIEELEHRFRRHGVVKVNFWIKIDNKDAIGFYEKAGYDLREDIVTMSKVLRET